MIAAPPPVYPWPIGVGVAYHPPAYNPDADGRALGGLRCTKSGTTFAVHVELFAKRRVVIVPPGIGAGPHCSYPLRTATPTGVVHVGRHGLTLADLFRVWGRRLSATRLLAFPGKVSVYVAGKRWHGEPGAVPLTRHAQIVVETGGYVAPHPGYLFPKGDG